MAKLLHGSALLPPDLDIAPARRRLFEVALQRFADDGYHAVSIRDIADTLGQQSSAIYFHVESKMDLLFELASMGHRLHNEALRAAILDAGREPHDQLAALVRAHVGVHVDYPAMARLTNREMRALSPDKLDQVLGVRIQSEQIFVEVIERGVSLGAFDVEDTFLAMKAISGMALRIPEWRTADTPRTRDEIVERYVGYALRIAGTPERDRRSE